jgi:hypothetical protein
MTENISVFLNTKKSKIIFLLSIIVSAVWVLGSTINIYQWAVVGAIFEMLWLPVLALIPTLAVISIIFWIKDKLNFRSLNLYSFLIILLTLMFTICIN